MVNLDNETPSAAPYGAHGYDRGVGHPKLEVPMSTTKRAARDLTTSTWTLNIMSQSTVIVRPC